MPLSKKLSRSESRSQAPGSCPAAAACTSAPLGLLNCEMGGKVSLSLGWWWLGRDRGRGPAPCRVRMRVLGLGTCREGGLGAYVDPSLACSRPDPAQPHLAPRLQQGKAGSALPGVILQARPLVCILKPTAVSPLPLAPGGFWEKGKQATSHLEDAAP